MEDLIWRALRTDYSIEAHNPGVEDLVTRRSMAGMMLLVSTYLVVMKPTIRPILQGMRQRRVTIQALMSTRRRRIVTSVVAAAVKQKTNFKVMKTKMSRF
jgi:hypothetical protein